jgi:quercetin dioxygenase-like cupin family protein
MADAVSVAPDHYKVVEENDQVRLLEFRGKPGNKTAMHSHPAVVAVAITGAEVRFTLPNGQSMDMTLEAGHAMHMGAADHATEILGTSEAHVILVELK